MATDKDPELYLRMQEDLFRKEGTLTKETQKRLKKDIKRLQSIKESKEFYDTLSKSYFNDPFYQPSSITMRKGVINYKSLTKQIEGICKNVRLYIFQIIVFLDNMKDKFYLLEMERTGGVEGLNTYQSVIKKSDTEIKRIQTMIKNLFDRLKLDSKLIN